MSRRRKQVVIALNGRQFNPPEWEAWIESEPVAHARDLELLLERFPDATVVDDS